MIRRPPRSTLSPSSAASDVYKRQLLNPPAPREQECAEAKAKRTQEAAALIKCSGADVASKETAQKLLAHAKAALVPDLFTDEARALLDDLCRLFVERRG